jgi:hypothetical protein
MQVTMQVRRLKQRRWILHTELWSDQSIRFHSALE